MNQIRLRRILPLVSLAALVYAITAIPYVLAYRHAPPGMTFEGVLVWQSDHDAYFSFIRQAADGHFLFDNRLTSLEHGRAFFNLEWLLVGRVMRLFHGSTDWAFQLWRAAGALSVVGGFVALTRVALARPLLRRIAVGMALFGGAFHTLVFALNALLRIVGNLSGMHVGRISALFLYFTVHPYAQILVNPHFALPLGIFMLAVASYIKGELTAGWRWYALAGGLAFIEALMRPYELMVLYTAIPVFVGLECLLVRAIDWRKVWLRTLPLLVVAPVFAYTLFIFEVHPIFKYWASQGVDPHESVPETLALMGLASVLLGVRLWLRKKYPFKTTTERFLLIWLSTVFFFIHANSVPGLHFLPYSPQLTTSLMPSLILLGVVVLNPADWRWKAARPTLTHALLAGFLAINALDSVALLHTLSRPGGDNASQYVPSSEMAAFKWLDHEAAEEDVVLSLYKTGHTLAKYASVHVVVGHWSVTPHAVEVEEKAERIYRGELSPSETTELLKQWRVKWIYFGPNERALGQPHLDRIPGFTKRVINEDVTIYAASS